MCLKKRSCDKILLNKLLLNSSNSSSYQYKGKAKDILGFFIFLPDFSIKQTIIMAISHIKSSDIFFDDSFHFVIDKGLLKTDYEMHSHQFNELFIITKGSSIHKTNSVTQHINAGDVFVINSKNVTHGFINPKQLELYNIIYTNEMLTDVDRDLRQLEGYQNLFVLSPFFLDKPGYRNTFHLNYSSFREVEVLIGKIYGEYKERKAGFKTLIKALFVELVVELCRGQKMELFSESSLKLSRFGKAVAKIEKDFTKPIIINELASIASVSERQFLRIFNRCFGYSPKKYITNLRLTKAKKLLNQNTNIAEVAYQCGFNDPNYFTRKFKEVYGYSPSLYKELGADEIMNSK